MQQYISKIDTYQEEFTKIVQEYKISEGEKTFRAGYKVLLKVKKPSPNCRFHKPVYSDPIKYFEKLKSLNKKKCLAKKTQ